MTLRLEDLRDIHAGEPCVLLGNGPSLDTIDVERIGVHTVGMNRSWRKIVSPYHCIFSAMSYLQEIDRGLWKPNVLFVASTGEAEILRWMKIHIDMKRTVVIPKSTRHHGVWADPSLDGWRPSTTGAFALRIAAFLGFNPIYLIGYDCNDGEGHFTTGETQGPFADDRDGPQRRRGGVRAWRELQSTLSSVEPDLKIINLNPDSAITCWPTGDLSVVRGEVV